MSAPAVILSVIFGWNLPLTMLAIGVPAIVYTMFGGVQAVTWTDVKQMFVDRRRRRWRPWSCWCSACRGDVGVGDALHLAGATGRLQAIDFRFDLEQDLHVLVRA